MRSFSALTLLAAATACALVLACDQRPADPGLSQTIDVDWTKSASLLKQVNFSTSVWASSDHDVYAGRIAEPGRGAFIPDLAHFDGVSWKDVPVQTTDGHAATSIWGSGSDDVYVAAGVLNHFNGAAWSVIPIAADRVTGSSPTNIFISNESAILHFNGADWDTLLAVDTTYVVSLVAAPDGTLFAGLDGDQFMLWNGTGWSDTHWPTFCGNELCAFSKTDAFAIATCSGPDRIFHWDGVSWTQQASVDGYLEGIAGRSGSDVVAVGLRGVFFHYDGVNWRQQPSPTGHNMQEVWGSPAGVVIGADADKVIWVGSQGVRALREVVPLFAFAIAAESRSRFVVADGLSMSRFSDGSFVETPLPRPMQIRSIACRQIDDVYAIADYNFIAHFDGNKWDSVDSLATELLLPWVAPDGTAFVAGDQGIYRRAGGWERIWTAPADDRVFFNAIGGDGGNGIVVGGQDVNADASLIMHFDGNAWSTLPAPPDESVGALWSGPGLDLYLAGYRAIYHWDGTRFRKIPGPVRSYSRILVGSDDGGVVGMSDDQVAIFNGQYLNVSPAQGPRLATYAPDGTIVALIGRNIMSWKP